MKNRALYLVLFILNFTFSHVNGQTEGCTDKAATNFNSSATNNDGSCIYNSVSVTPIKSWTLPDTVLETSGLVIWNNLFWTHNDNSDLNIYSFDTTNINNILGYPLSNTTNVDWEEISQDDTYFYIGDFGNNANGNRTDLKILRIDKSSITTTPAIDTIHFSYSMQNDFSPTGKNNTNFDCESFIVTNDSIYLFTKEWINKQTSVYVLPKTPGTFVANLRTSYNVQGLITGATFLEKEKLIALCGYSATLQPFLYLLFDFNNDNFFTGNKRNFAINLPFHQVEAIASEDGLIYYISNEMLSSANITAQFHKIDLTSYLKDYIDQINVGIIDHSSNTLGDVYPNPTDGDFSILLDNKFVGQNYSILDLTGKIIEKGIITYSNQRFSISNLASGTYLLIIEGESSMVKKLIKVR